MPLLSPYLLWGPPFIFFSYFGVFGDLILGAVKRHNLRRSATLLPTFVLRSGSLCVKKVGDRIGYIIKERVNSQ